MSTLASVIYRPQFAFPKAPKGCEQIRCTYSYDASNTPLLSGNLAAGATTPRIPLLLDRDADFLLRAVQISSTVLAVGLEDQAGHALLFPPSLGLPPTLAAPLWGQCDGGPFPCLDSDNWGLFCRKGAALRAYVQNSTAAPVALPVITLHGVKRFTGAKCR